MDKCIKCSGQVLRFSDGEVCLQCGYDPSVVIVILEKGSRVGNDGRRTNGGARVRAGLRKGRPIGIRS